MPENQTTDTEEQIFEAASRVFQRKGYAGARMQEIADEADINKSMLHYYYRSKDKLFTKVYQREMSRFFPVIFSVMDSDDPLDQKVEQLVGAYYSFLNDNPKLLPFLITEMNQNPQRFHDFIKKKSIRPPQSLFKQIKRDIEKGKMDAVDPKQLLVSIVALTLFPFAVSTLIKALFELDEQQFLQFLQDRKEFLVDFILNAVNYSSS